MATNFNDLKSELEKVVQSFGDELKNIKTGRANPALVEDLKVDYFGAESPIKQVASISATDARSLVITPWNKDDLVSIEKAVRESDLGVNPINDGTAIRINFPPLTEERREELTRVVGKKAEEHKIKIRKQREDVWDEIQKQEKKGEISEDDKFRDKEKLQEIVNEYNEKVEEMAKKKSEEVMKV